ncbi:MAG: galactitol-1-phosphate 5-dehydrogenase [Clostridiales Family XIII bacterium]|jgi:L-iditol 2-dehydrogenase|nr:galactitol-1-phosphate 5-dehydrogenase [Clostridiales Family XIII bacterium]
MKALNLHGIGDLRYENAPMPEPGADEVLLKVLAAGICGSDIPRVFTKGAYHFPTIIGHEFAGEIAAVGAGGDKGLIGKRAAVFPLLPCFACDACQEENYASCAGYGYYGSRRDGAFAEYIAVKKWNLIPVPESVPSLWAAMAEPCAVAIHALGKAGIGKGGTICIFGAGAIGLIIAQLARGMGAKNVVLLDVDPEKLAFARGQGFEHALDSSGDACPEAIRRLTGGKGADACVDAAGAPAAVAGCLKAAGASSTVVLMGNPAGDMMLKQQDYWEILRKQLTLKGTWNSDFGTRKNDWKTALRCMENGMLDLSALITHTFPLKDAAAAFELARDRNEFYVKILFLPNGQAGNGNINANKSEIERNETR